MPSIKTPKGKLSYKTIPLFPGVKQINKKFALENLLLVKQVLDSSNIEFLLTYGTLLGAVREKDFITHDEDIDLAIKDEYRNSFLIILPQLFKKGFKLVRHDRRDLYSLMRLGEYIDFYFFRLDKNGRRYCSGEIVLDEFFREPEFIDFHNAKFATHSNYLDYLLFEYGEDWNIPRVWNNYNYSKWKRILFCAKEHLKDLLPNWLYFKLASTSTRKLIDAGEKRILQYKLYKDKHELNSKSTDI